MAALPRAGGIIAERMRHARQLLDRAARSEAAPWLLDVLAMKPTHAGANYELGLLHLSGAGVAKDESYAIELLNAAAKQGHLEAAFKLRCLHMGRGELLQAQRAFEEALHERCASSGARECGLQPWHRAPRAGQLCRV